MKKRFLALFMTFVMMFTLIPVEVFATDAVDTPNGVVVEAAQEEVPETDTTGTEAPAVEEPVIDPIQQLYDALMACATYEELDAYMEAMSEEDYALMAQFTDEQNAALTAKIKQLQENEVDPLEDYNFKINWNGVDSSDVKSITIFNNGKAYTVNHGTTTATFDIDRSKEVKILVNYTTTANDTYKVNYSVDYDGPFWNPGPSYYSVSFYKTIKPITFGHLDIKIKSDVPITITHKKLNIITNDVISTETKQIKADIINAKSITFAGETYTEFVKAPSGDTDTRISGLRIPRYSINENTTASMVLDLKDTSNKVYKDVVVKFNYAGIQQGMLDCDSWGENKGVGAGIDFIPANGSSNSYSIEYTQYVIPVEKVWNDDNNRDNIRPASVTFVLYANDVQNDRITLNAANNWKGQFEDKDSHDASGKKIAYRIEEIPVPGYTSAKSQDGFTITNTHTIEKTTVSVSKVWNDAGNQDNIRPDEVKVQLKANSAVYGGVVTLNKDNQWSYTWNELPKNEAGAPIAYTVEEVKVPTGYTPEVTGSMADGFVIKNSHTPETTYATVVKEWNDADNQDGIRPTTLVVKLSNGKEVTLNKDNNWTATVDNLPKYSAGKLVKYTWTEETVPTGYVIESNVTEGNVTTIKNKHVPEKTEATVVKEWDDAQNQDNKRPTSLTVTLSNGKDVILNEANGWTATVKDLPKYSAGKLVEYTWTEGKMPEGYTLKTTSVNGTVTTLTNSYTPEVITIEGEKVWVDADDQDRIRPEKVVINLLADGDKVKTATVTAADGWKFKFTNLAKYDAGREIVYTITEEAVAGYTSTVDGFTVKNTHIPEKTEVTVSKNWVDDDDNDRIRPESVTINLMNGETLVDTVVLSKDNQWEHTFANLDKNAAGVEIKYTVVEEDVEGYTAIVTKGETGFVVTNTHESKVIDITVNKVWKGGTDRSATIKLYANGEEIDSAVLTAETEWTHTFEDLKVYENGEEIVYTVDETDVPANYKKSVKLDTVDETTGNRVYTVTNTKNDPYIPPTNEGGNTTMWMGIMTASLLAMGGLTVVYKKRY